MYNNDFKTNCGSLQVLFIRSFKHNSFITQSYKEVSAVVSIDTLNIEYNILKTDHCNRIDNKMARLNYQKRNKQFHKPKLHKPFDKSK